MLQGICYYGNSVRQIRYVFNIESLRTISANKISISDFWDLSMISLVITGN